MFDLMFTADAAVSPNLAVVLLIYLGSLVQGALLLDEWEGLWVMLGIAALSLLGLGPGEGEYVLSRHVISCLAIFYVLFALVFINRVLPVINERTLVHYTLVFHYWFWTCLGDFPSKHFALTVVLTAVPTIGVLVSACTPLRLSSGQRLAAYLWYLAISIALLASQILTGGFYPLVYEGIDSLTGFVLALTTGMSMLFLFSNVFYILALLPVRFPGQTAAKRMQKIQEHAQLIVGKYSDEQLRLPQMFLIICVQGGLVFANYHWKIVDDWLAINLMLMGLARFSATQKVYKPGEGWFERLESRMNRGKKRQSE